MQEIKLTIPDAPFVRLGSAKAWIVKFNWENGSLGNWEEPEEPDDYELLEVILESPAGKQSKASNHILDMLDVEPYKLQVYNALVEYKIEAESFWNEQPPYDEDFWEELR